MKYPQPLLLFCTTLLLCLPANFIGQVFAEQILEKEQIQQLQKKYQQLHSISFSFRQKTWTGGRERQGLGDAVFYRLKSQDQAPGKKVETVMRWNYTAPDSQIILNDGKELSIYTATDKQMIVTSAEELNGDITYAFFSGTSNLLDTFQALPADERFAPPAEMKDTTRSVQLIPIEPHAQIKSIHLWYDKDLLLKRLLMEDHFDAITEIVFSDLQLNALAKGDTATLKKLLDLKLPADTEILRH